MDLIETAEALASAAPAEPGEGTRCVLVPALDAELAGAAAEALGLHLHPGRTVPRRPRAVVDGDEVDLLATDPGTGRTSLVASAVRVLAVPEVDSTGSEHGVEGALVVLSLSPEEVPTVTGVSLAQFLSVAFSR